MGIAPRRPRSKPRARDGPVTSVIEPHKARRLYLLLRDQITSGRLPPGARLPGEPALAAEHGLARVTVRRAL
ncbi:GntR family transcriptional regulator, partial [Methylobacterium frigidaeris]|uniref:GntR family transcriptional regulator n=1 Tax=Methylobacterium frigidaeris TaxID=2038277 RepID=UPI0031453445